MPTAGGPNTLGESNLVFAYDTGDVKNSYKGQPTVNTFGTYPTDLYNWASSGNACTLSRDTIQSPVGNTPLKMVTLGNDAYTNTYNSTGNNISAASSGQTWTISVWAKANQNTVGQIFHFGANSSGNIIDFGATGISLTTEWTRYTYTRTFTDGNVVAIQTRLDGADAFQSGDIIWWDGLQVEQKAYATQFTTGTRSATQGLLPLIGNSTIDLTNVSFNSNAQMTFDGTNDYIYSSVTLGTEITLETVIQSSNYSGNKIPISINGDAYSSGPNLYFTNNIIAWNTGNGDANPFANSYYPNSNYHHIVVTNVFGGTAILYIDGIQIGTATSLNTTTTGTNKLIIGDYHDTGYAINANIPITKIYNRALTAQEVKQNYQQYKTRFNLS
jgi:hypothetical protein